jgi:hypothetical protein
LTVELRQTLNGLIGQLNNKIEEIVASVNAKYGYGRVRFVNADPLFEGHRFCEEGVVEPDGNNPNTWFFLFFSDDSPSPAPPIQEDREPLTDADCKRILAEARDWGNYILCAVRGSLATNPSLQPAPGVQFNFSDLAFTAPESYIKFFHPKTAGHTAVVQAIHGSVNTEPVETIFPALVMFSGSMDDFNTLTSSIPRIGGTPITYQRDGIDLQGYYVYMSERTLNAVKSISGVQGISWYGNQASLSDIDENFDDTVSARSLISAADSSVDRDMGYNSTSSWSNKQKRQITQTDLHLQLPHPPLDFWHLKYISQPPVYSGASYWQYNAPIFDPAGAADIHHYIIDSGVDLTHTVGLARHVTW